MLCGRAAHPGRCAVARTEELLHDASGDTWAEADLLESLSGPYAYAGRSADARAALDRSQSLIASLGVKLALAVPNIEAGHIELTLGDPVAAERRLRAGYETLQAVGARYFLALATIVLAEALYDQGRFDAAAQMSEEPLDGALPNFAARAAFVKAKLLARRVWVNWYHSGSSSHDGMAGTGTPVITKRGNSDNHDPCLPRLKLRRSPADHA